ALSRTSLYSLPLHDALPIYAALRPRVARPLRPTARVRLPATRRAVRQRGARARRRGAGALDPPQHQARAAARPPAGPRARGGARDRKSTRLNSSHVKISYAV